MGKQGPCRHCGATSTPLWRNGPPEKPVLCNACGSRWRTKGTLANYVPSTAHDGMHVKELKANRPKTLSIIHKGQRPPKKVATNRVAEDKRLYYEENAYKTFEVDCSNRSSTESAVSNSESCAHHNIADANDMMGSAQSVVWPSKRRTQVTHHKPSPVEKLAKDLYTVWQEQQSSCPSVSSEEDLVYLSDNLSSSFEIGYGSELIRPVHSRSAEDESEASSLPVDSRLAKSVICDKNMARSSEAATGRSELVSRREIVNTDKHVDASVVFADFKKVHDQMDDHPSASALMKLTGLCANANGEMARALPPQCTDDSADEDLLLDAPLNGPLPDAQFLRSPPVHSSVTHGSTAADRARVVSNNNRSFAADNSNQARQKY